MKLINTLQRVTHIDTLEEKILMGVSIGSGLNLNHGNKILILEKSNLISEKDIDYHYFMPYKNGIVYYKKEGDPIIYSDFSIDTQLTNEAGYFNPLQNRLSKNIFEFATEGSNYSFQQFVYSNFPIQVNGFLLILWEDKYMYYNKEESTIYVISLTNNQPAWTYRIPDELTIETWGNSFFSDQSHLFMKLHMGGIMAFSLIKGVVLWKWFGEETYPSFCTAANSIYVNDGKRITEININNGQPERILDFHNLAEFQNLRANGSIFGYDDILVFKNSHSGEIAVFDRNTFKLIGRDIVDPLGIADGPKVIHYVDGFLYVMGMSSKVNIYKVFED